MLLIPPLLTTDPSLLAWTVNDVVKEGGASPTETIH